MGSELAFAETERRLPAHTSLDCRGDSSASGEALQVARDGSATNCHGRAWCRGAVGRLA
jgi:hypothetical protein